MHGEERLEWDYRPRTTCWYLTSFTVRGPTCTYMYDPLPLPEISIRFHKGENERRSSAQRATSVERKKDKCGVSKTPAGKDVG